MHIVRKSTQQLNNIRTSCQYLNDLMRILYQHIEPGMTLLQVEAIMTDFLEKRHLRSAFYGYEGFPGQLCLSNNDCVVHGIPDKTILKAWDLLKVDLGIDYRGGISDSAFSIVVGWAAANPEAQKLIDITKQALDRWLEHVKSWAKVVEYAQVVQEHVYAQGMTLIKDLTWHGVGNDLHEDPYIYNYPHPSTYKTQFVSGMVVALEPITAQSSEDFIEDPTNERNLYTEHGDLGAQWEYTVYVSDNWPEIRAWLTSDFV